MLNTVLVVALSICGPAGVSPPSLSSQNIQPHEKSPISPWARDEAPTMSLALGTNPEGKERVKGKTSRIESSRIGSALVCVRRNAQHLELRLLESTRYMLNIVLMVAVSTCGLTGCPASPPPLSPQNIQSHEKSPINQRARGETQTISLALGANPEGKERVAGKALNTSDFFGFRFFGFHFEYGLTTDERYSRRKTISLQEQSLKFHTFIIFS